MATSFAKSCTPFSVLDTVPPRTRITKVHTGGMFYQLDVIRRKRASETAKFVASHSNATVSSAKKTLQAFFDSTLEDCYSKDKDMMAQAKSTIYVIATPTRAKAAAHFWHRDNEGSPDPDGTVHSRYSMTMVGPPTDILFSNDTVDAALLNPWLTWDLNASTFQVLEAREKRPLRTGQIYRFTTGQKDSPIHSTPVFETDRIFVTVFYY